MDGPGVIECSTTNMSSSDNISYFILKCANLESLQKCIETGEWACQDRVNPPHPRELLISAHERGRVILIFSVNSQHGWHGFCESLLASDVLSTYSHQTHPTKIYGSEQEIQHNKTSAPNQCGSNKGVLKNDTPNLKGLSQSGSSSWYYFPVKWLMHFQAFSKQTCLSFDKTQHLSSLDGSFVNKARNWQEVGTDVGSEMCHLLEEYHCELTLDKQKRMEEALALREDSYFKAEENAVVSEVSRSWAPVIGKVEKELGKVHLVCPFGSQRYNCSLPSSDNDIFIVYQAMTTEILSLDPPKQTIKNSDKELVDYTILELQRYCELLLAGDPRCVETLFLLDTAAVSVASSEWRELCSIRDYLLTKTCFDKYMKEAQGTTGLKQLRKWRDSNPPEVEQLSSKHNKLGYIILRLLQSARDMTVSRTLKVFRDPESLEKEELLAVRQGSYTYSSLMALFDRYLSEIDSHRDSIQPDKADTKAKVQNWLLDCRIQNLQQHPHVSTR